MRVIEVYADVACPFAHVGLRRFMERRAELGCSDLRLRVRAWPLELVNGSVADPGFIDAEIDEIRAQVACVRRHAPCRGAAGATISSSRARRRG